MPNPQFIDSHCHLYLPQFKGEQDAIVKRAAASGIHKMLVVGVEFGSFPAMIRLVEAYPGLYASVGVHPSYQLPQMFSVAEFADYYGRLLAAHPGKIVAIGEIGLDYFRKHDRAYQHTLFKNQIQAAIALDLPVIIHTRDAREDTLQILREYHTEKLRGVIHCFSEDWAFGRAVLDLGFLLSFSGVITMPGHPETLEAVANVPDNQYLIETDAPYLTPHPKNNRRRNEPAFVVEVAAKVAEIKGIDLAKVARDSTDNFGRLFGV